MCMLLSVCIHVDLDLDASTRLVPIGAVVMMGINKLMIRHPAQVSMCICVCACKGCAFTVLFVYERL